MRKLEYHYRNRWTHKPEAVHQTGLYRNSVDEVVDLEEEMAHSFYPANENRGAWTVEAQYCSVAVGP
ncbi:hypothetical protein AB205_0138450 [Aquarana catesbeiana]|uniref:Uncharacterized protein n=1 Tax=Aquarana catesbeiana TaxID=8400 RepID=A0A2G9RFW1_AQUCT|nr:hypothetical protein AB205_0138450 [Aquarana catesbeiana]